jgi:hypothetical protein
MTPIFIWFLSRIVREVKRVQEGVAMGLGCYQHIEINGRLGYAIQRIPPATNPKLSGTKADTPRPPEIDEAGSTWQLTVAQWLFLGLLLGTHRSYRTRLQKTRVARSVDLEEFRTVIAKLLDEWTGTLNIQHGK